MSDCCYEALRLHERLLNCKYLGTGFCMFNCYYRKDGTCPKLRELRDS